MHQARADGIYHHGFALHLDGLLPLGGVAAQGFGDRPTGLGMHIARRMVERHRGSIGLRNRADMRGATYWFELPR